MVWYYLYMGLLVATLLVWALVALRTGPPDNGKPPNDQQTGNDPDISSR